MTEVADVEDIISEIKAARIAPPSTEKPKTFKDECYYCYKTPLYPGGLFISLLNYHAYCSVHVHDYAKENQAVVFVRRQIHKITRDEEELSDSEPNAKRERHSLEPQKFDVIDDFQVVTYPNLNRSIPITEGLGQEIYEAARLVEQSTSKEVEELSKANDSPDIKLISSYSDKLQQLDNGKIIPYSDWKCEYPGCGVNENLWLNLSDGSILCGRSQYISFDKTTKGNNHAKKHYEVTQYPLVVKLGTISKHDTADVYSYPEDDFAIDGNLRKHLAHFGLDMDKLEKTVKTTEELETELNRSWEFSKCVEDGTTLVKKYGAPYTGLLNIGNSCYMNSVLQALLMVPAMQKRFADNAWDEFKRVKQEEILTDFNAQFARLFSSVSSGEFSKEEYEEQMLNGIKPKAFKTVIAGNHPEFKTGSQQDAEEYLRYIIEKISEKTPSEVTDPTLQLKFKMETRFEDLASKQVNYKEREEIILGLPVRPELMDVLPMEEGENNQRYMTNINRLLYAVFSSPNIIDGYKSPVTGEVKGASTIHRFMTFPDFLVIQIQKFYVNEKFEQAKYDLEVLTDDTLDISHLRATGIQPGEVLLPENVETTPPLYPSFDRSIVDQLIQMGFSENACIRAAVEVHKSKGSAEDAMEWILAHLEEPNIDDPIQPISKTNNDKKKNEINPINVSQLVDLGFTPHQSRFALNKFQNDVNQACNWLFENAAEVPEEIEEPVAPTTNAIQTEGTVARHVDYPDGDGKYKLIGFITHMGAKPQSGHYVAHLFKNGEWVLFNDEKVGISQNPPRGLAYLYIYQRC